METITTNRRYDIDWLRVIAIGLLLIYHIAIGFQPWGVFIRFIQCNQSLVWLWAPMAMLNVWRIPLLFFVSGMGVCFAIRKRNFKQLIIERTRRIFIPFLFGILFIAPIHVLLWQKYYYQDLTYSPNAGHLWFLLFIYIYVVILSPLFFYLKNNEEGTLVRLLKKVISNPLGLLIIPVVFILETFIIKPEIYTMYAMTMHGFILGFLSFLFGYILVLTGNLFWQVVYKWKWVYLILAASLYIIRIILFNLEGPNYLNALETCFWIFSIFGFSYRYLNKPSKTLSYLSQGAYPIYIIHMIFLFLASYIIFPLNMPVLAKFILTILFTSFGCFILYELIIRRIRILRLFFGLKTSIIKKEIEINFEVTNELKIK